MADPEFDHITVRDKVLKWIDSKWTKSRNCPICDNSNWTINPSAISVSLENKDRKFNLSQVVPYYVVSCENCGYTQFFNAIQMGIFENTAQDPHKTEEQVQSEKNDAKEEKP
jgi:predicted nucleic-acid-binding Zn-ribbon protein